MASVIVRVTKHDIRSGVRSDPDSCPVTRALRRTGVIKTPWVGSSMDKNWKTNSYKSLVLDYEETIPAPRSVVRFVNRYDNRKPVKPFSFIVRK